MEENNQVNNNNSTQYIRSGNMGNTIDNKQRHSKEEDAMNPSYTNPPIGNKDQESTSNGGDSANSKEDSPSSDT